LNIPDNGSHEERSQIVKYCAGSVVNDVVDTDIFKAMSFTMPAHCRIEITK